MEQTGVLFGKATYSRYDGPSDLLIQMHGSIGQNSTPTAGSITLRTRRKFLSGYPDQG
jgi:hypothetical protein